MRLFYSAASFASLLATFVLNGCSPATKLATDATEGNVAAVKADLARTPADAPVGDGVTALAFAAAEGRLQVVQMLLAAGAKADTRNGHGTTPLMSAANGSEIDGDYPGVIAALVAAGADPNAKDKWGNTPLIFAAMRGEEPAVVPILVKAGAQVNAPDAGGTSALSWAAQGGKVPMMRALIAAGAMVDGVGVGESPLDSAASNDRLAAVQLLISAGANVDGPDQKGGPLTAAAVFGYVDVAQALLNAGANVNGNGPETPLKTALDQGHADVATLLKQHGGHA